MASYHSLQFEGKLSFKLKKMAKKNFILDLILACEFQIWAAKFFCMKLVVQQCSKVSYASYPMQFKEKLVNQTEKMVKNLILA